MDWNKLTKIPLLSKEGVSESVLGYNILLNEYYIVYFHNYFTGAKKWRDEDGNTAEITHWQYLTTP